ncbi:hypothetical protein R0K17_31005, partial [Planococcus sp. SIMBA_143]
SKIDLFFLYKMNRIVEFEKELSQNHFHFELGQKAKRMGFSDITVAKLWDSTEAEVYNWRKEHDLTPVYKMVDTCAAEF